MIFALLAESDDALKLGTVLESRFSGAHLRGGGASGSCLSPPRVATARRPARASRIPFS